MVQSALHSVCPSRRTQVSLVLRNSTRWRFVDPVWHRSDALCLRLHCAPSTVDEGKAFLVPVGQFIHRFGGQTEASLHFNKWVGTTFGRDVPRYWILMSWWAPDFSREQLFDGLPRNSEQRFMFPSGTIMTLLILRLLIKHHHQIKILLCQTFLLYEQFRSGKKHNRYVWKCNIDVLSMTQIVYSHFVIISGANAPLCWSPPAIKWKKEQEQNKTQ